MLTRPLSRSGKDSLIMLILITVIGTAIWLPWYKHHFPPAKGSVSHLAIHSKDPYYAWRRVISPRARFSLRYPPTGWTARIVPAGSSDVEHILIDGSRFHFDIATYAYKPDTACPDCLSTVDAVSLKLPGIGKVHLSTVTVGVAPPGRNALILTMPDGTYYLPSVSRPGMTTTFRGISELGSAAAERAQTYKQFVAEPDFATAQQILVSVSY